MFVVYESWGSWTPWTPCSADCGTGNTRFRQRFCPSGGGSEKCVGPNTETRLCNDYPCSGMYMSIKITQNHPHSGKMCMLRKACVITGLFTIGFQWKIEFS